VPVYNGDGDTFIDPISFSSYLEKAIVPKAVL
jgi:hypothetical protein